MQHIFLKGTVTALLVLLLTSLVLGAASVPNLINFQGRLTDASGNPVADGSHTINYTIWDLPTGGTNLWTENTSQTTSGGLFTHQLGSTPGFALPQTLFDSNDSLYLQIQADGQTITPRIRLTSTPYTRVSQTLETGLGSGVTIESYNNATGGNLDFYDENGNVTAFIEGDFNGAGGFLFAARNAAGATAFYVDGNSGGSFNPEVLISGSTNFVDFDLTTTGDPSVILPSSAINAAEMFNEPGVSYTLVSPDVFPLSSGNITYVVDSVDITIPAAGYVEVTCGGTIVLSHTNGTTSNVWMNAGKTRASVDLTAFQWATLPAVDASGVRAFPSSTTRLFAETAGTHRYYLNVRYISGTSASTRFELGYIRATYYPTLYGSVTLANASASPTPDHLGGVPFEGTQALPALAPQIITMEDHNTRLEAELSKLKAEMNLRLAELEKQLKNARTAKKDEH